MTTGGSAVADPAYRRYLAATGVSSLGDATWFVALGWGAAQLGDLVLTSVVLAVGTVPRAVLLPLGGAVADRLGLRRVMVGGDLVCAGLMLVATVLLAGGHSSAAMLGTLAALVGVVDAVYIPAAAAAPRALLDADQLASGNGASQLLGRLAMPLGAPLGGQLVAHGGLAFVTGLNSVTYVLSAILVARLRLPPPVSPDATSSLAGSTMAGLAYVARRPTLVVVLVVMTLANMASGPVIVVGIPLRAQAEGWGAQGIGWFSACFAVGATLGSVAVIRARIPLRRAGRIGTAWLVVQGLCITALGIAPSLSTTLVAGAVTGLTAGPASALLLGLVQGDTEVHFQARVMSLVSFAGLGLAPIALAGYGLVAELSSVRTTAAVFGGLELAVAAAALLWFAVRRPAGRHARPPARRAETRSRVLV